MTPQGNISPSKRRLYTFLLRVRPTIIVSVIKAFLQVKRISVNTSIGIFWIDPVSMMGQAILSDAYEPSPIALIKDRLKPGQTFIDVGANEGFYSVYAARLVGSAGRVVAIEPQKRLIPVINENFRLNNISNGVVVAAALNDGTTNQTRIWLSPSTITGASSIVNRYIVSFAQAVACKTLSQVVDHVGINVVDFVKIDVEGFELEVLKGAFPLLATKRIRHLYVDYHTAILNKRGLTAQEIHAEILSYGYIADLDAEKPSGYVLYTAH
jgi:FkbM family methyltransferase